MPNLTLINFQDVNGKHYFTYGNTNPENVARVFANYMASQGYRLEKGDVYRGTYGVGNQVLRILFGAFVKRHTFDFAMQPSGENVVIEWAKNSNGWTGGVIGIAKTNTEFSKHSNNMRMM